MPAIRSLTATLAALAAACGLCLGACGGGHTGAEPSLPRDVILISIDTLRADHLGCYGYRQPTSPNLDRFRQDAVLFSQTIAAAPSTLASHASIMTSLLPRQHGAAHTAGRALSRRFVTLAGVFRQHGYQTASWNDGGQVAAAFGLDNGFDLYRSTPAKSRYRLANNVEQAARWLRSSPPGRHFIFLHTYEVHHPYIPEPGDLALMEQPYRGPLPAAMTPVQTLIDIKEGRLHIGARDLAHIVATYDAGIRTMDAAFGRFVESLKQAGRYDQALIVFTSDHGEEFAEHGQVGWHANTLYDELLRIPLLVKYPDGRYAGETVASQVRNIDIAPTMLAVLGWPAPAQFRGADLTPLARGQAAAARFAVSQIDSRPDADIRTPAWKLDDGRLFDLRGDPGETHDVGAGHPEMVAFLSRRLSSLLAERPGAAAGPRVELSADERARLRSLGYLQ